MLRYRFHGANMSLGADAAKAQSNAAAEMPFRRWLLTDMLAELRPDDHAALASIAAADLVLGCRLYEHCVLAAAAQQGRTTQQVVPRQPEDPARAFELVRRGHAALVSGDLAGAMLAAARAFGHDVHDANVRALFDTTRAVLEQGPPSATTATPTRAPATVAPDASSPIESIKKNIDLGRSQSTGDERDGDRVTADEQRAGQHNSARLPARVPRSSPSTPRVTLGIATYDRDTYLAEAIASCSPRTTTTSRSWSSTTAPATR